MKTSSCPDVVERVCGRAVEIGVAGLAIVSMAIVFDRTITAASRRTELAGRARSGSRRRSRLVVYGAALAIFIVGVVIPAVLPALATWPESWVLPLVDPINAAEAWIETNLSTLTTGFANFITVVFINPLESLLTNSPFLVVIGAFAAISAIIGKWRLAITSPIVFTTVPS